MAERPYCTKDAPMPQGTKPGIYYHNDAKVLYSEDGSLSDGGSFDRYECPHCGFRFWVELPD